MTFNSQPRQQQDQTADKRTVERGLTLMLNEVEPANGDALVVDENNPGLLGKLTLGSMATVTPTGTPDGTKFLRDDNTWQTPSGSSLPTGSTGDLLYHDGTEWKVLAAGTTGQILTIDGDGLPSWAGGA